MANGIVHPTPKDLGYSFPAEWHVHRATWLSYPHNDSYSWPGTLKNIFPFYNTFIKELSQGERVCINIRNEGLRDEVMKELEAEGVDLSKIDFLIHPTNDAWCRDHGPAFLLNPTTRAVLSCWGVFCIPASMHFLLHLPREL